MQLRWHVVERFTTTWDDRDKEWDTQSSSQEPVLQMKKGKRWVNVPTVKTKRGDVPKKK